MAAGPMALAGLALECAGWRHSWVQILILNKTVTSFVPWQRPPSATQSLVLCTGLAICPGLALQAL